MGICGNTTEFVVHSMPTSYIALFSADCSSIFVSLLGSSDSRSTELVYYIVYNNVMANNSYSLLWRYSNKNKIRTVHDVQRMCRR